MKPEQVATLGAIRTRATFHLREGGVRHQFNVQDVQDWFNLKPAMARRRLQQLADLRLIYRSGKARATTWYHDVFNTEPPEYLKERQVIQISATGSSGFSVGSQQAMPPQDSVSLSEFEYPLLPVADTPENPLLGVADSLPPGVVISSTMTGLAGQFSDLSDSGSEIGSESEKGISEAGAPRRHLAALRRLAEEPSRKLLDLEVLKLLVLFKAQPLEADFETKTKLGDRILVWSAAHVLRHICKANPNLKELLK